jgi:hypothetical protein
MGNCSLVTGISMGMFRKEYTPSTVRARKTMAVAIGRSINIFIYRA